MASRSLCNPEIEQLHLFYEPLTLLRILGANTGKFDSSNHVAYSEVTIDKFLDHLAWMCDFELGGATVCAIALESTPTGTNFWLATGYKYAETTHGNLQRILKGLESGHRLTIGEAGHLEREICNECIAAADKKVENYARILYRLVGKACEGALQSDSQLCRDLQRLADLAILRVELCSAADQFRNTESIRQLSQKVTAMRSPSVWSLLRHYIGRLGSWHRASRTLVEFARAQPQIFKGSTTRLLITPRTVHAPLADDSTNLHCALRRMFPQDPEDQLAREIDVLQGLHEVDMAKTFYNEYTNKNFKPRVHAEVYLLEHFYQRSLSFVKRHRYIGCSKPSCYCCDLYLRSHPGAFVRRPTHGNIWINWQPPLQSCVYNREHATHILNAMTHIFRQDVKSRISSRSVHQLRVPDSTTGLTYSSIGVDIGWELDQNHMRPRVAIG